MHGRWELHGDRDVAGKAPHGRERRACIGNLGAGLVGQWERLLALPRGGRIQIQLDLSMQRT